MRRLATLFVSLALTVSCGGGGDSGPPHAPISSSGGTSASGGSGGSSGTSTSGGGSGGSSGTSTSGGGSSAAGGSGGGSGAGGSAGTGGATLGPTCPSGEAGQAWSMLDGTYMLKCNSTGGGTDAYFTLGNTYEVDVKAADCTVTFHHDSGQFVLPWTGAVADYAGQTVPGVTWTIHIQKTLDPAQDPDPECELNWDVQANQMGDVAFCLPMSTTCAGFSSP